MNQRSTGLVVGLVIFVILTVGLLASTIYFISEAKDQEAKAKDARTAETAAKKSQSDTADAYGKLAGFVTGDPGASPSTGLDAIKKALGSDEETNLKLTLETLRSKSAQMAQDLENAKKQMASAQADAAAARDELKKAHEGIDAASKRVEGDVDTYHTSVKKYDDQVKDNVSSVRKLLEDTDSRHRNELGDLQRQIDAISGAKAELSARLAELQGAIEQYRAKPKNAAELSDGRVVDVGMDGEVFISIGAKQRVQPGMTFDVYDGTSAIQYNPATGDLIPGKARIQVLKVEDTTSTARVIPEDRGPGAPRRRPIVKDDVIANVIFSPNYHYKFLVVGKFDVDNDGTATAAEAEYVRGRIKAWGGEVVDGDALRGDVDFVVMGKSPVKPVEASANADPAEYQTYMQAQQAYDAYDKLVKEAHSAHVPVLNWNRLQVLTNEGR